MAEVTGFVPSKAQGKRNKVERYVISTIKVTQTNGDKPNRRKEKDGCCFCIHLFVCDFKA